MVPATVSAVLGRPMKDKGAAGGRPTSQQARSLFAVEFAQGQRCTSSKKGAYLAVRRAALANALAAADATTLIVGVCWFAAGFEASPLFKRRRLGGGWGGGRFAREVPNGKVTGNSSHPSG